MNDIQKCKFRKCRKPLEMKTTRQEYCDTPCRVKEFKASKRERNAKQRRGNAAESTQAAPVPVPVDHAATIYFGLTSLLALMQLARNPSAAVAEQITKVHLDLMSHRGNPIVDAIFRGIEAATAHIIRIVRPPHYGRIARILGPGIGCEVRARIDGTNEEVCLDKGDFEARWPAEPAKEPDDNIENEWPFVDVKQAKVDVCFAVDAVFNMGGIRAPTTERIAEHLRKERIATMSAIDMALDDGLFDVHKFSSGPHGSEGTAYSLSFGGRAFLSKTPSHVELAFDSRRDVIDPVATMELLYANKCPKHPAEHKDHCGQCRADEVTSGKFAPGSVAPAKAPKWVRRQLNPTTKIHTVRKADPGLFCCGNECSDAFHTPDAYSHEECKRCVFFREQKGTATEGSTETEA